MRLNDLKDKFTKKNKDTEKNEAEAPQSRIADLYDWLEVFTVSIVSVFIIFAFIGRVAVVDGSSMNQTLNNADKLIVRELFYEPKQGDIVVCLSENEGIDTPLVKRVIATEGQKIRIDSDEWAVYVDGEKIEEDYTNYIAGRDMGSIYWMNLGEEEYIVPEGKVFVMGDNRTNSKDSRMLGPIDERYIIGKVVMRFMPFKDISLF